MDKPKLSLEQIDTLLSGTDLTKKERISVKTITKVFMKHPKYSAYNECKYSYQNIVDRFSTNNETAQLINSIMMDLGCFELFKTDIKHSIDDKDSMRGTSSPGYTTVKDSDIPSSTKYYVNIQSNETIYSYIPLKQIVALFQDRGLVFKEMSTQDKLQLPKALIKDTKRYFSMPWTTHQESIGLWEQYSEWTDRKRKVTGIAVCVELDAKTLYEAIWKKSHDAEPYIIKDARKQARSGYNVKAVLSADKKTFADRKRSLEVRFSPKGVFLSYSIDPRLTPEQQKESLMTLKQLGIDDSQIKNTFYK